MEKKYVLCPRCELNYMLSTEKYCQICKAELGLVESDFLLPDDDDDVEGRLCSICHTNYCEEGDDICIECKKEKLAKEKSNAEESEEWMDDDDVSTDIDGISLSSLDEEEGEEETTTEVASEEDDFEYVAPEEGDFEELEDDEEESDEDDDII